MWASRVLDEDGPVHSSRRENLEIGIRSLASLDTAADPTSLPHFAAPGPSRARQFHSLACFCLSAVVVSSLLFPSLPSFLHAFFHSLDQPSKAVSLVCSAGHPNDELAGLCRGPLDLTNRPVIISFRAAPIFVGASEHHQGRGHSSDDSFTARARCWTRACVIAFAAFLAFDLRAVLIHNSFPAHPS